MILRQFRPGDTAAVVSLWHECGLTRPWNDPVRDIERKVSDSVWGLVVGESDGELVAAMMVGYDGHRGSINYLAVAQSHRGRGLGKQLMDNAESMLRARGCPKINISVRGENAAVIGFYRSLGYQVAGPGDLASLGRRLIRDS